MTSTFSGLSTAYSGLVAARQGLDVTGQNIANSGTAGYTRQRVTQSAIPGAARVGLVSAGTPQVGQGVSVDGIQRLANGVLDTRVRTSAGSDGYASTVSGALSTLEDGLGEPGTNGLAAQLGTFWSAWQTESNHPDQSASASAVLSAAGSVAQTLSSGSASVDAQWTAARGTATSLATTLNDTASRIAQLNDGIRTALSSGGSANELIDQRDALAETVASLAGGTVRDRGDGTVDVVVGGNALVSGTTARSVEVTGATRLADAQASPVALRWADGSRSSVDLDSGKLAGTLAILAPAASGTGGALAEASASYDRIATQLARSVNALHEAGTTPDGRTGVDFFSLRAGVPAAQGLTVIPTDASGIASRAADGSYDGSVADRISQLGTAADSPDRAWAATVSGIGAASQAASSRATVTSLAATTAKNAQQSESGVNLDEENVNLLTYQHAYQGAARVLTAIDSMLDTLINHTGEVGR